MPDRPPVDPDRVRAAAGPAWPWITVVERTTSTNADLLGDPSGADRSVLVAEEQTSGRGRLDRAWTSPPRAGLLFSVALRPVVPVLAWGWIPLLTGVALTETVRTHTRLDATLKWPNDLLLGEAKAAGILVQSANGVVVLGVGLNVSATRDELPVPTATSLLLAGADTVPDRSTLLGTFLARLDDWWTRWSAAAGDARQAGLDAAYREACSTVGRDVRVSLADGEVLDGRAVDIDGAGRIVVDGPSGRRAIGAGDVEHLRATDQPL